MQTQTVSSQHALFKLPIGTCPSGNHVLRYASQAWYSLLLRGIEFQASSDLQRFVWSLLIAQDKHHTALLPGISSHCTWTTAIKTGSHTFPKRLAYRSLFTHSLCRNTRFVLSCANLE